MLTEPDVWINTPDPRSHMQENGNRDKPLPAKPSDRNRPRVRTLVRVKQVFGHHAPAMDGTLIRTSGGRARPKIGRKNLGNNVQRGPFLTVASRQQGASYGERGRP
ncbi:hypothetical protein [Nitrospira sp. Ecomares 2.1]